MSKRIGYFDFLRAFSVVGVIVVHSAILAVNHYGEVPMSSWWFGVWIELFARSAVPLFIMIAGALALTSSSTDDWPSFMMKKVSRLVLPSVFYFFLYGWWSLYTNQIPDVKTYLIKLIIYGVPYNHLYFIFVIFGLYIFAPFLKRLVEHLSFREYTMLLIIIFGITGIWDFSAAWVTRNWTTAYLFSSSFFVPFIGYFLAGHYFHTFSFPKISTKLLAFLFLQSSLFIAVGEYLFVSRYGVNSRGLITHNYQGILVMTQAISLFLLSKSLLPGKASSLTVAIARASFGMYLIHQIIIDMFVEHYAISYNQLSITTISLIILITLFCSFSFSIMLSKLPFISSISGVDKK